jgi:F-type H+-transporting ATPase subunit g
LNWRDWWLRDRGWPLRKLNSIHMIPPSSADKFIRSLSTFQTYFQPIINAIRNPSTLKNFYFSPQSILARVWNLDKRELAFVGVTAAEVIGFFTVGEMIGRFKIVGYRGEPVHEH